MSDELAIPEVEDEFEGLGLDDFDAASDGSIPRFNISGDSNAFIDSLSGEEYNPLRAILLGFKKQRVLWPPTMGEVAEDPWCKSVNPAEGGTPGEKFPWEASGFSLEAHSEGDLVPCDSCLLSKWGSHPDDDKDTPWCTEQFVFPSMVELSDGNIVPAILTFQRSSLAPARRYVQSFARGKKRSPMFTVWTEITLEQNKRGSVKYSVPSFKKDELTAKEEWRDYADTLRQIEAVITTRRTDSALELPSSEEVTAAISKSSKPVMEIEIDDIPFDEG